MKANTEVTTMVGGPGVYICDGCVSLCNQLIAQKPTGDVPRVAPWDRETSLESVLGTLPTIAAAGAQVEENLAQWARKARSLGATWARIGEALNMTRQSAWERFSGEQ
jgi:hypothetical protein